MQTSKLRLGVSACLLGEEVRYNGGHKHMLFLTTVLGNYVEWVPVCPEVEMGMGVPRETIRLEGDAETPRLIAPNREQITPLACRHGQKNGSTN